MKSYRVAAGVPFLFLCLFAKAISLTVSVFYVKQLRAVLAELCGYSRTHFERGKTMFEVEK